MFVMNTWRNLVLRLNYKQNLDLEGLNIRNLVQCLQYSILIPLRAMFNKGPEVLKKEAISVTSNCLKTISL